MFLELSFTPSLVQAAALSLILTLLLLFPKSFHTNAGFLYTAKRSPVVVMDTGQTAQPYSQTKYDLYPESQSMAAVQKMLI